MLALIKIQRAKNERKKKGDVKQMKSAGEKIVALALSSLDSRVQMCK